MHYTQNKICILITSVIKAADCMQFLNLNICLCRSDAYCCKDFFLHPPFLLNTYNYIPIHICMPTHTNPTYSSCRYAHIQMHTSTIKMYNNIQLLHQVMKHLHIVYFITFIVWKTVLPFYEFWNCHYFNACMYVY